MPYINHPRLEPWQENAAEKYFEMGVGAWPEELHKMAYQITHEVGMCGDVMFEICRQYVWEKTQEYLQYYNFTHHKATNIPPADILPEGSEVPLRMIDYEKTYELKPEVKKRWME